MTNTTGISPLRQRMIDDMVARGLGPQTQKGHIRACKRFAAYLKRSPELATADDVKLFQLHLIESGLTIQNRNRTMTGVRFRGTPIPQWEEICAFCRSAAQTLPCLRVVGWDVAILPGGKLELIEGNHNPGMNIVQAPAKHGVHDKFAHMLLDFYGDPAQYAYETVKQP